VRLATGGVSWGSEAAYYWCTPLPLPEMLDEIVEAGFRAVERSSNFPEDTAELRQLLEPRGLELVGAFSWVDFLDPAGHGEEIGRLRAFGLRIKEQGGRVVLLSDPLRPHRVAIAGRVTWADRLSEAKHAALVAGLNRAGEMLAAIGMRPVFHPHAGTCVETRAEIDRLLAGLDPSLIGYCPDTGHIAYAGDDPVAAIVDYADRTAHVHIKDVDLAALTRARENGVDFLEVVRLGVFTALGQGGADLGRALRTLRDVGYDGWLVVEQDAAARPLEDAIASRRFVERVWAS
jgi:inosose dehydratase